MKTSEKQGPPQPWKHVISHLLTSDPALVWELESSTGRCLVAVPTHPLPKKPIEQISSETVNKLQAGQEGEIPRASHQQVIRVAKSDSVAYLVGKNDVMPKCTCTDRHILAKSWILGPTPRGCWLVRLPKACATGSATCVVLVLTPHKWSSL